MASVMTHPFDTNTRYELTAENQVRVSRDGKSGLFTGEGVHISGDLREADPQLCVWITNNPSPDTQLATSRLAGRDENLSS